jgi:hypothetical protein
MKNDPSVAKEKKRVKLLRNHPFFVRNGTSESMKGKWGPTVVEE